MKRRSRIALVLVTLTAWAAGCDRPAPGSAPAVRSVRIAINADEGSLQPYTYVSGYPGWNLLTLVYDTLFVLDEANTPRPWLARQDVVSDDGLTHTLHLRTDVRWHDGRPLTSADVAFSFDYYHRHPHGRWSAAVAPLGRVDTPDGATALGAWTCGGGATFGKVAYLASRADNDWYKITLTGVGPACPAILDVSASWGGGGATVRPQISLVYPDAPSGTYTGTPCAKDEECRFLRQACGSDDNRCQYLGNQCDKQAGRCTGAAVCLPEKQCGVLQFAKQQTATGGAASVRTAQPLTAAGTYYIRVRDFQGTGYDAGASYSLAVRLSPDEREPNNFYSPYNLPDNGLVRNAAFIMQNKIALDQTVTSRIGYERDQDFYVLDHPCPGADCTLSITYSTSQASRVYHTFQVEGDGRTVAGFPAAPAMRGTAPKIDSTVFGDGVTTCFYASKGITGPYYLWVSDLLKGGPLWDQDTTYSFTVRKVQDG